MSISPRAQDAFIFALLVAVLLVVAIAIRPPVVRPPVDTGPSKVAPAVEPMAVLGRLREIRFKFHILNPEVDATPDAPGSAAELDRLMRDLISDYDLYAHKEEH